MRLVHVFFIFQHTYVGVFDSNVYLLWLVASFGRSYYITMRNKEPKSPREFTRRVLFYTFLDFLKILVILLFIPFKLIN